MPENEFEKKVSSELQQLRFKPSDTVWMHVEERIRKKDKRRVFIIFFLLAGLALLGYWQRDNLFGEKKTGVAINENNSTPSDETNNSSPTEQNTQTTKQNETTVIQESENSNEINDKTDKTTKQNENTGIKQSSNSKERKNKTGKTNTGKLTKDESSNNKINNPVLQTKIPPSVKKIDPSKPNNIVDKDIPVKAPTKVVSIPQTTSSQPVNNNATDANSKKDTTTDQINNKPIVPDIKDDAKDSVDKASQLPVNKPDEKSDSLEQKQQKFPQEKNKPAEKQKTDTSKKVKKWYAGVNIQGGNSNTKRPNGLFAAEGRFADANSPLGGGATSGAGGVSYNPTHEVRSRMSLGLGVFARKELSEKFYLNIGLNYSLLRTGLRVGKQMATTQAVSNSFSSNASINNFYRPPVMDSNKTYINKYHFLGLQSEVGWRFTNWPLTVNLGVEYSRLLGTNSLLYERRLPGFYQDKDAFVKNHLFISGGLSLRIAENKKYCFELNPFIEGSLTKLYRSDTARLHYSNFGLRLRIFSKR